MTLRLASGDWEAGFRPRLGGALTHLRRGGVDLLRRTPDDALGPLEAASFALVPYANRVDRAQFDWSGQRIALPANFAPEPHSLHGLGWHRPWDVASEAGFKCELVHSHDGSLGWPWAYTARQRARLGPRGLALSLEVTNRAAQAMPCGLGFHPYFRRRPETRVTFSADSMVEVDAGLIPTGAIMPADRFAHWSEGPTLPTTLVDHCFTGWNGEARIEDELGTITLSARGAPCLHIYAPPDGSALCLEPVSHPPDALNQWPEAMTILPPGCSANLQMWIG